MPPQPASPSAGRQILLVEDEPTLLRVLDMILTDAGYVVTTCRDGDQALRKLEASPGAWDLVVSDVTMPRLSGDRLALALREIQPRLPVILMTGNTMLVTPRRLHALGVAAVLEKPCAIEDVLGAVDAVFDRARRQA
jgi:Response regulator containing CheY-like receiver, AAA-type ATPase, and DNA-binding domains